MEHGKLYDRQKQRQFLPVVQIGLLGALDANAADIRERAQRPNHEDLESPQKQDCRTSWISERILQLLQRPTRNPIAQGESVLEVADAFAYFESAARPSTNHEADA